jgi:3-oxoadipyl-CoA thiolase
LEDAVIVAALRTPIGRYRGALKEMRPDDLAALVIRAVVEKAAIDPKCVDDVFMGCANQAGEDNRNVARMGALLAGLPVSVPGVTVNRLCGSGLEAVIGAANAIRAGVGEIFAAGGVESMTRAPWVLPKMDEAFARGDQRMYDTTLGWRMVNPHMQKQYPPISLGETAEVVAERYGVSRAEQDEFAFASQQKAQRAITSGAFTEEIVPVSIPQRKGDPVLFTTDEHPRPETTLAQLSKLSPAFKAGGTVTAGNASGLNDGAAALLIMSARAAARQGLKPMARVVTSAVAGVDPSCMGIGPVPATRKALQRAGLGVMDLDLIELNEAFAAQGVACINELGLDPARVNVHGGAIALGHPLGCSGARITTTLLHAMQKRGARYGLATMCIGVGQGISAIFEQC